MTRWHAGSQNATLTRALVVGAWQLVARVVWTSAACLRVRRRLSHGPGPAANAETRAAARAAPKSYRRLLLA